MPLINFGSILGFAEEIENQHLQLYNEAAGNPDCAKIHDVFEGLAKETGKRIKELKRVRRENVTEMILETIEGFRRDAFVVSVPDASAIDCREIVERALIIADRSIGFYEQAAERLKGQPEVARTLRNMAKKHEKEKKKLKSA